MKTVLLDAERKTFLNMLMLQTVHILAYSFPGALETEKEMTCHTNYTRVLNSLSQSCCMQESDWPSSDLRTLQILSASIGPVCASRQPTQLQPKLKALWKLALKVISSVLESVKYFSLQGIPGSFCSGCLSCFVLFLMWQKQPLGEFW